LRRRGDFLHCDVAARRIEQHEVGMRPPDIDAQPIARALIHNQISSGAARSIPPPKGRAIEFGFLNASRLSSRTARGALARQRADPGPRYPSLRIRATQGDMGPGSRAKRRSAGMTTLRLL